MSINQTSPKSRNAREQSPSSDESEDEDEVTNGQTDAPDAPPSTQYEILRDKGFEHLDHAKEDDQRATQRFLARAQQIGDNHAVDNAIIEEITCINFMCHSKLHVELGPLINFVVGHNGSGKSAVLTAITLCLGGKAASTNRGSSLKSLIKSGEEHCILIIRLKNKGHDAYQPDTYGDSIIIERHFSRSGSSGYKLKNHNGRLISSKKGDVDDIIEYYQLQVDNPMNVLTQDAAKSFITQSTPAQKYKFFVEGVQLQALDNDYKLVCDTCDSIENKLLDSAGDIEALKKKSDDAHRKAEVAAKFQGMRRQLRNLCNKMAWAQVKVEETKLADKDQRIVEAQRLIEQTERLVEEKDVDFQQLEARLEKLRENEVHLEEEKVPLVAEVEEAKSAHNAATKEIQKAHTQASEVKKEMVAAQGKVQGYKKDIEKEVKRLEESSGGAQTRKVVELQEAEQLVTDAQMNLAQNEAKLSELEEKRRTTQDKSRQVEPALSEKTREVDSARSRLNGLNQDRGDVMAGFPREMANVIRAIRADKGFRDQPIGPMGLHIRLKKPEWSSIIERYLGAVPGGFIVTNADDRKRLNGLLKRHNMTQVPIIIGKGNAIDTSGNEPDSKYDTVLRVLEIDNEMVKRQLIIGNGIDQTILIKTRAEGMDHMLGDARLRNVKRCLTFSAKRGFGHSISYLGRGYETSGIDPYNGRPRMTTDIGTQIAHQSDIVKQLDQEKIALSGEHRQISGDLQRYERAIQQNKRDIRESKIAVQRAEQVVDSLKAELEDLADDDNAKLEGLKGELRDAESNLAVLQDTYGNSAVEKENLNKVAFEKKKELDAKKALVIEQETKVNKAREKIGRTEGARKIVLAEKNHAVDNIDAYRAQKEKAEASRQKQAEHVENFVEQATAVCRVRPPLELNDTPENLEPMIEKLDKAVKGHDRQNGGTEQELNERALLAKEIYKSAKTNLRDLEELLALLKQSFLQRIDQFRRFQRYISSRSRINFNYLLSERAFRGKLAIDHRSKLLDVHVEPDETVKKSKGRETKTLSGGEKSFSSICLLLALWEAMGAPLRCLDEYDVFMDDVNRDVSTKMIVSRVINIILS